MSMNLEQHVAKRFEEEIVSYFTDGFEDEGKIPLNEIEISNLLNSLPIDSYVRKLIKWFEEDSEGENVDIRKVEDDIYREILHEFGVYDLYKTR
jgi:hypothetical protein